MSENKQIHDAPLSFGRALPTAQERVQKDNFKNQKFTKKQNERFELLFVGDTSFGENYQEERKERGGSSILERYGYDYSLEKMKPLMQSADFVVANLETPITDLKQSPYAEIKDYIHWTDVEKAPRTLISHHVSLVSLANNHAYDFGREGYKQTMDILERYRVPVIGAGDNIHQAGEPFIGEISFEKKSFKFAIIAAFEELPSYRNKYQVYADSDNPGLMPLDMDAIAQQVQKVKNDDPDTFVIVFPHWGSNYHWAEDEQREMSDMLFAMGVDLILGHGAHMIQEFEKRKDKWAVYSLGNFMFNSPGRYEKLNAPPYSFVASMGVELINDEFNVNLKLYPIFTDNRKTDYQPRFLDEEEFYDLSKLLQRKNISEQTQYHSLKRKQDQFGYYIELPIRQEKQEAQKNQIKWLGMMCRPLRVRKIEEYIHLWMHRAMVIEHELSQHNAKLFCYSPLDVLPQNKTARGYVFENGQYRKITMPIPRVNYDWYIGEEDETDRPGLDYDDFATWAKEKGLEIYPSEVIRDIAGDKLLTAQILSQFDKSVVPLTQAFARDASQLQKFLASHQRVFIKPQFGSMGNGIFVIKQESKKYRLEYYEDGEKISKTVYTLQDCLDFIKEHAYTRNYIIQEGIECVRMDGSVIDIRVIMIHDGQAWHFLSQIRVGATEKELSNLSQGGQRYTTEMVLQKVFPEERLPIILDNIKKVSTDIARFLKENTDDTINEIALDLLIDKNEKITLAELNVKPGTEGRPENFPDFFNMTDYEKSLYENLSLKHGKYLAQSLIYREMSVPAQHNFPSSQQTRRASAQRKSEITKKLVNKNKWIGFIWRDRDVSELEENVYTWMHRPLILEQELAKYNYKLLCYAPTDVNPDQKTVRGYIFENNWFKKVTLPIPQVNYDYLQGPARHPTKSGFSHSEFHHFAKEENYEVYPPFSLRKLTTDKLLTTQMLLEFNPAVVPYTELFTGEIAQLEKLLEAYNWVFIKPRFGGMGEDIFVVKNEGYQFLVEYYAEVKKESRSFNSITDSLAFIKNRADADQYVIQEAITVARFEGSVFDVRLILFRENNAWNIMSALRIGAKDKDISNASQGGDYSTQDMLAKIFSPKRAPVILEKVHQLGIDISNYLDGQYNGNINEISFDIMIDKTERLYIAELNVPPGLAAQPDDIFNMTETEKYLYEEVTLKHMGCLAKSLLERCSPTPKEKSSYWFEDIQSSVNLSQENVDKIIESITDALQNRKHIKYLPEAVHFDTLPRIVFISVSDNRSRANTTLGTGSGLLRALNSAIQQILDNNPKLDLQSVKLDIVQHVSTLKDHPIQQPLTYDRSLYGIAFEEPIALGFLPEEVVSQTLVDSDRFLHFNRILRRAHLSSAQKSSLEQKGTLNIHAFSVQSYYKSGENKFPLYRGHRLFEDLDSSLLLSSAIAAGDYLISTVKEDGNFIYEYMPKNDSETNKYNVLRHAGTIYSMLELYEVTKNPSLLQAAILALKNLMLRSKPVRANGEELLCIVENDSAKLGANGLALLALSKYMMLTEDRSYLPDARKLAKWMQTVQNEQGQFFIHKLSYSTQADSGFVSMYYPGEAIFSLVRFYEVDPNETWLDMAQKAADYIIQVRDGGKTISELEHDHWLLYGLNELYRVRPSSIYITHSQKICQAMLNAQHRHVEPKDYLGGFYNPPRSTPVAVRSEGMCAAYCLLNDNQLYKEADVLFEAIKLCLRFQLQTQYFPEKAMHLPNPQRTLGGFSCSLTDYSIRIDYVQHNLSSLIGLYKIMKNRKHKIHDNQQTQFQPLVAAVTPATKWVGMICNIKRTPKWQEGDIFPWMFRQFVLDKFLAEHNYKLVTYAPSGVDSKKRQVKGYMLENRQFKQVTVPIPQVNYDFFIGKSPAGKEEEFTHGEFDRWALKKGYDIYPIKPIRSLAGDKLLTAQLIAEYDSSIVPYTEDYNGKLSQIEKFLSKDNWVFIKPRFGNKGNNIFVMKHIDNEYVIEFYLNDTVETVSFKTLAESLPFMQEKAGDEEYIIQQAIRVLPFEGSVFDIRTIVFKENSDWHFLTELVVGKPGKAVSNLYQGGQNYPTEIFLNNLFSKDIVAVILEKIKKISIDVASILNERYEDKINEIAFDLLLDTELNLFVSEINVKPGLAGEPTEYDKFPEMTEEERKLYETVTLKHGEYLVRSLLARV